MAKQLAEVAMTIVTYEETASRLAESYINGNRSYVITEIESWTNMKSTPSEGIWIALRTYELLPEHLQGGFMGRFIGESNEQED